MSDFLIKRNDLRRCRIVESEPIEVGDGQVLLRIDNFGLSANNVTYAVMGEAMSYWDFFPTVEGWGRVPVWGFADVEQSKSEGVESGTRVYGYLPPSTSLLVRPTRVDGDGFVDSSPHRAALPSAYHRYLVTESDPFYSADTEEIQMLLRPLFFTSFLIDDQLADEQLTERGPIVLSSASSKTAIAAAFLLAQRERTNLIGLTSPRNTEFVESLGIYSRTVTYEEIDTLDKGAATYVDIAGAAAVRQAVHSHFGDGLLHSMVVGASHWEELGSGANNLPGPSPAFFFAPDRVAKRSTDWGRGALEQRVADAWHPFCRWTGGWLGVHRSRGFEGVERAYRDLLEGRTNPRSAHAICL